MSQHEFMRGRRDHRMQDNNFRYNPEASGAMYGPSARQPLLHEPAPYNWQQEQYYSPDASGYHEPPMRSGPPHRGRGQGQNRRPRSGQGRYNRPRQDDQGVPQNAYGADAGYYETQGGYVNSVQTETNASSKPKFKQRTFNSNQHLGRHSQYRSYQEHNNQSNQTSHGMNHDSGASYNDHTMHTSALREEHVVNRNTRKQAYDYQRQVRPKQRHNDGGYNHRSGGSAVGGDHEATQKALNNTEGAAEHNRGRGRGAGRRGWRDYQRGGRGNFGRRGKKNDSDNDETQRGRLIEELRTNAYECMVCCEIVRKEASVWSCRNCYHIFHLHCVKKWARTPAATALSTSEGGQGGWRCPSCQNVSQTVPYQYWCYCSKVRDPELNHFETPHSCGGLCARQSAQHCTHPCTLVCHPGPCPPCHASVVKACQCGKSKQTVQCGQAPSLQCTEVCQKTLNCGKHQCQEVCHPGPCEPCVAMVKQECFCSQEERELLCGSKDSYVSSYTCNNTCNRKLGCDNHSCVVPCHPGECLPCVLLPQAVTTCPCGRCPLSRLLGEGLGQAARTSCLDPVPTCTNVCDKDLPCGPENKRHQCQQPCHAGPCEGCEGESQVRCVCGAFTSILPCAQAKNYTPDSPYTCERRCNKKLSCIRHKCPNKCCMETEHTCGQVCGRRLTCQQHRCEEPCHRGNCPTCWHVSFDELSCECGVEVLYPPIPCGALPPECRQPCTRTHICEHQVRHNCHSDEQCPPCTQLTQKWCHGKHERRKNIACHVTEVSCGMECGKDLPCGQHKCTKICHKGECHEPGEQCQQACPTLRQQCAHPCAAPCHPDTPCPDLPCKAKVELKCECGQRVETLACGHQDKPALPAPAATAGASGGSTQYQALTTSMLAMKIADAQDGQTFDISSLTRQQSAPTLTKKKLECSAECAQVERNKRLALALQIHNPDISSKLGPTAYTQFLKDFARQNASLVASVEGSLRSLVETAQKGKQARRSHAFPAMKGVHRRVVHELAEYYGLETQSYDEEPNTNVVATGVRGRCWLPGSSLTSQVQREIHPKAPPPMPFGSSMQQLQSATVAARQSTRLIGGSTKPAAVKNAWGSKAGSTTPGSGGASKEPVIDYFDVTD